MSGGGAGASGSSPPAMSCGSMSMSMDASAADGDICDFSDQEADGEIFRMKWPDSLCH